MMTARAMMPAPSEEFEVRVLDRADPAAASALALVLSGQPHLTDALRMQVANLTAVAERQWLRLEPLVAAFSGSTMVSAVLAIESPGRSALVYAPPHDLSAEESSALGAVLVEVNALLGARGVALVQGLLPPDDRQRPSVFARSGYRFLAELIYMERSVTAETPKFMAPRKLRFVTYGSGRRPLFLQALEATYRDSLDCPGLAGLRRPVDVLAGHMATGVYDPAGWFLAMQAGVPVGVLLAARAPQRRMVEIVYMGVAASARGQGVGNCLMNQALRYAQAQGVDVVSLAVDSVNEPARRLYQRWRFRETMRRRAWIGVPAPAPAVAE